jgi:hypothetical protein
MTTRPPLDPTLVYREYVSQLSRGRGAPGRTAAVFSISRQRVDQIVAKHEAAHPLPHLVRNTPDAAVVRPEPSHAVTGHAGDDLSYIAPPGGYPNPEPRSIPQYPAVHIMSPPLAQAVNVPIVQAFERRLYPDLQLQVAVAYARKRRRRVLIAEMHLILCAMMTALVLLMAYFGPLDLAGCLYVAVMIMWAVRV